MTVKLKKWGNSIGVKIPKKIAKRLNLSAGSEVVIEYSDQKIFIFPKEKCLQLKDLLDQVTKDNCHPEIFCEKIGKEVW